MSHRNTVLDLGTADYADGATDARAVIQAMLDAANPGDVVSLPPGSFLLTLAEVAGFAGYYAGLTIPSGVTLAGSGQSATTLTLAANQTPSMAAGDGVSIIYNADLDGSGDVGVEVRDLTIDGNAANQGTATHNGISWVRTRGARCRRVTVKNVRGQGNAPPDESFHFDTQLGLDTGYLDCTALGDAGSTASGFSANNATAVRYHGCDAYGMTEGMGFTHHECEIVSYLGCHAYLNGDNGFNSEESQGVSYTACHAGGEVASGSSPWPLAAGTSLGNTASGFVVNGTRNALLTSCTARKNATGLSIVEGTAGASGRLLGCAITDNTTAGVSCSTAATLLRWQVDNSSIVDNNNGGATEYNLPTGWTAGPGNELTTPAIPASGVAYANPYPFAVTVYITAPGTIALLRVNGADIDTGAKSLRLLPGMTVTIFYSAAPSWLWFAD